MSFNKYLKESEINKRTRTINGLFYHLTKNANEIIKNGFDLNKVGTGYGFVDLGEPLGVSFFLNKKQLLPFKAGKDVLEVRISDIKTLDARNIENGSWVEHDGSWAEFVGHIFDIQDEKVFDKKFVTQMLLNSGFSAVLFEEELRLLDLKYIKSINKTY